MGDCGGTDSNWLTQVGTPELSTPSRKAVDQGWKTMKAYWGLLSQEAHPRGELTRFTKQATQDMNYSNCRLPVVQLRSLLACRSFQKRAPRNLDRLSGPIHQSLITFLPSAKLTCVDALRACIQNHFRQRTGWSVARSVHVYVSVSRRITAELNKLLKESPVFDNLRMGRNEQITPLRLVSKADLRTYCLDIIRFAHEGFNKVSFTLLLCYLALSPIIRTASFTASANSL